MFSDDQWLGEYPPLPETTIADLRARAQQPPTFDIVSLAGTDLFEGWKKGA